VALVPVFRQFEKRALITRESARELQETLASLFQREEPEIILDFAGVDAVTPSFIDELLNAIDELRDVSRLRKLQLTFRNVPTRLSAKFEAIGRTHKMDIDEVENGVWRIVK